MTKLKFNKHQTDLLDKALEQYQVNESRNNLNAKQQMVFVISQMTSTDILGPKRIEDEDFEDYKLRRKLENLWRQMKLEGKFAWVSKSMTQEPTTGVWVNSGGGTYSKDVHGFLDAGAEKKANKLAERKLKNENKKTVNP